MDSDHSQILILTEPVSFSFPYAIKLLQFLRQPETILF